MYTIMVVDDSPFIVDIFVTMLERGGYRTVAAYGGQEALDTLLTLQPDLILLDIMMEPMDGWETLVNIKGNLELKDIPVMMLTAKQLTPFEAKEYGIYIEDYILKPITHKELYDAIERVLSRKKTIERDMSQALDAGFDKKIIDEYGRLSKSIDINRRLLRILETTYNISDPGMKLSEDINTAIRNMQVNLNFQEARLQQIREDFSRKPAPRF
jgi:CheY-like chemotaxis protein